MGEVDRFLKKTQTRKIFIDVINAASNASNVSLETRDQSANHNAILALHYNLLQGHNQGNLGSTLPMVGIIFPPWLE